MSIPAALPARKRVAWDLVAALAAYVALRALVLHTNFDSVTLWMYELYPMGTMAEFLQRGVDFPLRFYYDNAAGQILSGFLTLPCFALAGPSYLALKLVPFLLGCGVLVLAWRLLREHYGRLAANLAAWSLVLAPTTYFKYSLTNSGNHFENLFWSLLAISAHARLQRLGTSPRRLVLFGLAAGFALFVFLGALLPVGILALLHLGQRGWRATLRDLPFAAVGFAIGQLPLLALNLATGGRGLGFLGSKFAGEDSVAAGGALFERMGDYFGGAIASASTYPQFLGCPGSVANRGFFALLVLTWIAALPFALRSLGALVRGRPAADWFLLLFAAYVPLSGLAFGLSNLRLGGHSGNVEYGGYRYYLPWFLYGMLAAAVLAAKAWEARGAWRAGVLLVPLGVLLPGLSNFALVDWGGPFHGVGAHYSGYDLSKAARGLLAARNELDHDEQLGYLERFPPLLRASVARALGFNLAVRQAGQSRKSAGEERWAIDLCGLCTAWPEPLRREIARGAGIGLRFQAGASDAAGLLPPLRRTLGASTGCREFVPAFLEGLASANPALPIASQVEAQTASCNGMIGRARALALPDEVLRGMARGQGLLFGRLARRGIEADLQSLARRRAELPEEYLGDFYTGLGQGCALEGESPGGPPAELALPAEHAAAFWGGFVREARAVYGAGSAELEAQLDALERTLSPESAAALRAAR